jgi:hypothetical protein
LGFCGIVVIIKTFGDCCWFTPLNFYPKVFTFSKRAKLQGRVRNPPLRGGVYTVAGGQLRVPVNPCSVDNTIASVFGDVFSWHAREVVASLPVGAA